MITLKEILTDKCDYDIVCYTKEEAECLKVVLSIIRDKIPTPTYAKKWFKQFKKLNIDKNISICIIPNSELSATRLKDINEPKEWTHFEIHKPRLYASDDLYETIIFTAYSNIEELKESKD